jgi:hypothetical protein
MPDPSSAAVGSPISMPDEGQLATDLSDIDTHFDPLIQQEEKQAEGDETQAVAAAGKEESEAQAAAGDLSAEDAEMQHWVDNTPTRQAAYATSMHAAPFLAILTAIGGKMTRLTGGQMLAAQTGMMQGLNEGSEKKYNDALAAWQSTYQKMQDHQRRLMDAHKLMLESYAGRADAYQKAADAARRMTGDLLTDKQRQAAQKSDFFKVQMAAWEKTQRVNLATESLQERVRKDLKQEQHWKDIQQRTGTMPPEIKGQVAAEHSRWMNAKAQVDENMKKRGQIANSLTTPDDQKKALLDRLDAEDEALEMEMNKAQSNTDAIIAGYTASKGANGGQPAKPRTAGGAGRAPAQSSSTAVSPKKLQALQQNKGQPVKFGDGSTWMMASDGSISQVH